MADVQRKYASASSWQATDGICTSARFTNQLISACPRKILRPLPRAIFADTMHIEPSQHAPQSIKEFGIHYLMIVVGILTAVGIEQGIEGLHHRELATTAIEQIDEELRSNLGDVRSTLAQNKKRLENLKSIEAALLGDVLGNDKSLVTFKTRLGSLEIGTAMPALRRDAWDSAIADQAFTYVAPATVRRYSAAYSAQKDITSTIFTTFSNNNWASSIKVVVVDYKLGKVEQVELLKALASYELALESTVENQRELDEALELVVGKAGQIVAPSANR